MVVVHARDRARLLVHGAEVGRAVPVDDRADVGRLISELDGSLGRFPGRPATPAYAARCPPADSPQTADSGRVEPELGMARTQPADRRLYILDLCRKDCFVAQPILDRGDSEAGKWQPGEEALVFQ